MNERELTTKALHQLEFHTGLVARVTEYVPLNKGESKGNGGLISADALIQFDNSNAKLVAELKKWGPDGDAAAVIDQVSAMTGGSDKILISDFITEETGTRLREAKVNYLDRAGNAYLDIAPIYVLIQGKLPKEVAILDKTARLFTETGLKVIFALLANPGLLNANYREIANRANVSMGTIGWVLRGLKDQGFTTEAYKKYEWKNKQRLIKRWAEEYPELRSRHSLGKYYAGDDDWWQNVDLNRYDAVLGGEAAAVSYIGNTRPRSATIYVGKHKQGRLIRDLKLAKPDESKGHWPVNIEILSKFWGQAEDLSLLGNATHPLITYADLLDTWDPTSREIAKQIADKYFRV